MEGDEGVALVEFALVVPFLIVLLLGTMEFGRTWSEKNTLVRSTQSAARTGASQGPDRFADYNTLKAVEASLSSLGQSTIERVVIFRSDTANGQVPAACANVAIANDLSAKGNAGARCNIYSEAQVKYAGNVLAFFPPGTCTGGWDASWCPLTRSRGTDLTDPDYLGVYVKVRYDALTGVLGAPTTNLTATSVFRLDPCITGVSCA
jgi:hypothetical protein